MAKLICVDFKEKIRDYNKENDLKVVTYEKFKKSRGIKENKKRNIVLLDDMRKHKKITTLTPDDIA